MSDRDRWAITTSPGHNGNARARSLSPTIAIWRNEKQAREQMAKMVDIGLHVFNPEWQALGHGSGTGREFSASFREVTLQVMGTSETITIPAQTCTKVEDVKEALVLSLMLSMSGQDLQFVEKRGCSYRVVRDYEEMPKFVKVKGLRSFKRTPTQWPAPVLIIGAGYNGLKMCMAYLKSGNTNFLCFDRLTEVGGYCWLHAANKTSRLQTEFGSFHLWWGPGYVDKCGGFPSAEEWGTWPDRVKVLEHFRYVVEQYGIAPHLRLGADVTSISILGDKRSHDRHYMLNVTSTTTGETGDVHGCAVMSFPGMFTANRTIDFPNEEAFIGSVCYGTGDGVPYDQLPNSRVVIVGGGVFAIENVRTCCESGAKQAIMVCRRKNLAAPRVASWFIHQSTAPVAGRIILSIFEKMYQLAGFDEPWRYSTVQTNESQTSCTVISDSRFGIGDITFLAAAYGRLEIIEDEVKRLQMKAVGLCSGKKIEEVDIVIKALGLAGDFEFDQMHSQKEVVGFWCNGDWRRPFNVDSLGFQASNFAALSFSQHSNYAITVMKYLMDYPKEYYMMQDVGGILEALPRHRFEEDKPAYAINTRHTMLTVLTLESMCPRISKLVATTGEYKHKMYHTTHPLDKFLALCKAEWDECQKKWQQDGGSTVEFIPYPYTKEVIKEYFEELNATAGVALSPDGPEAGAIVVASEASQFESVPLWAHDNDKLAQVEDDINNAHKNWWVERAAGCTTVKIRAGEELREQMYREALRAQEEGQMAQA